jgi:hypothetical protein
MFQHLEIVGATVSSTSSTVYEPGQKCWEQKPLVKFFYFFHFAKIYKNLAKLDYNRRTPSRLSIVAPATAMAHGGLPLPLWGTSVVV